jgi:hypothetical protein
MKGRNVLTLGERLEVEAALDAAFAPLRERRTDLSPLRIRAAVRWGRGLERTDPPSAVRWSGAIRRLSELSVAVGMSVMILGGSLGSAVPPDPAPAASAAPIARPALPLQEPQQDMLQAKFEWLESLRARLDAVRSSTINDWLDPTVARPVLVLRVRTDLPAPRVDNAVRSGIY